MDDPEPCESDRSKFAGRARSSRRVAVAIAAVTAVTAGCGATTAYRVADGTYASLVPSAEQFSVDLDGDLPGGVAALREQGVDQVEFVVSDDQVVVRLDGISTATLRIAERVDISDQEGSGPFKAAKEIIVLAGGLTLGELVIDEPVIWPGSFEGSPVITVKSRDPGEQGPSVSCGADEDCLLLSAGVDPAGTYADANNADIDDNPIDSILIDEATVKITLDTGDFTTIPATDESVTVACGLSENRMWTLPPELGLPIDDPVLIHTLCPSTPGAAIQLAIMDRAAIPNLAPLTEADDGRWCAPGPDCLVFVPE